ncbi:S-layer homology domain-containing protein [Bacillus sp. NPDC094106]|uniref:S-layer homology domain-containing protein n=1 Tax=Bacillus sp. NPDC094106 TaxID=3363949 RepID=UPI003806628A
MNFKNVLATGLITATLFGATATTQAQTTHFNDVPSGHWSENSINYLADKGVVLGYGNGAYGFGDNVTRGQVTAIIARYLNLNYDGSEVKHFSDIEGHMFENSIKAVSQAGIMNGDNTDKFRPDDTLTRYEMAVILQKAFNLDAKTNDTFHDIPDNHWAKDNVRALYSNGVTVGIGSYQYDGEMNVTREQFAKFMYKAIFVDPNFVPEPIPEKEKNSELSQVKNVAQSYGFFPNGTGYTYNLYGAEGDSMFNLMDLFVHEGEQWEVKMFIYSGDSVLDEPVKQMFNTLLPTQSDYLFNIINNKGPKEQTFELDGRTVEVKRQAGMSILFGAKK